MQTTNTKTGGGDGKPPTPEEIAKKLADLMGENFGGKVNFTAVPPMGFTPDSGDDHEEIEESPAKERQYDFPYRPRDIKAHLDRFVIKQDEAKKVLSIAVCDHYNRASFMQRMEAEDPGKAKDIEFAKQNVIIVGPTGVGKTYLVKHVADLIGVPFVKADATKFSETGYVGGDVDDLIRDLVNKADGDVELAEHGIIYIDEVDKLATGGGERGRDVSGRGVQTALLKLMEDTEVSLKNPMDFGGQMQAMFSGGGGGKPKRNTVRTRHILFVVSGAFSGLEKVVKKRLSAGVIGFGAEAADRAEEPGAAFQHVATQDFIDFGFEAEFIGRLPVRVVCEALKADDLFEILKDSEGSLIKQYEREFAAYGIGVRFEDGALHKLAEQASVEKTGARGLVTVGERLLRGFKFELPGTSVSELTIDADLVDDPDTALARYRELGRNVDVAKIKQEVEAYTRDFAQENGITIIFKDEALVALGEGMAAHGETVLQHCRRLFKDYPFGLKLVLKNGGGDTFTLGADAVADPDKVLSDLVVRSYRGAEAGGAG